MERLGDFTLSNNIPFSFEGEPPASLPFATDNPATPVPYGRNTVNVPELDNRMIDSSQASVPGGSILVRLNGDRPQNHRSYPCLTLQEFLLRYYRGEFNNNEFNAGYYFSEGNLKPYQSVYTAPVSTLMTREGISFADSPVTPGKPASSLINVAIGRVARVHRIFGQVHAGDRIYLVHIPRRGFVFLVTGSHTGELSEELDRFTYGDKNRDDEEKTKHQDGNSRYEGFDTIPVSTDQFISPVYDKYLQRNEARYGTLSSRKKNEYFEGFRSASDIGNPIYIGMAMEDSLIGGRDNRSTNTAIIADRTKYTSSSYYTSQNKTLASINSEIEKLPTVLLYLD